MKHGAVFGSMRVARRKGGGFFSECKIGGALPSSCVRVRQHWLQLWIERYTPRAWRNRFGDFKRPAMAPAAAPAANRHFVPTKDTHARHRTRAVFDDPDVRAYAIR